MVTIRELAGALQHSILHQTSTHFTGIDHSPIETLAGLGNAQFNTSKAPLSPSSSQARKGDHTPFCAQMGCDPESSTNHRRCYLAWALENPLCSPRTHP